MLPERLPWHMVSRVTRVLQVCWLYAGSMVLLDVLGIYQADYQRPEEPPEFCRKAPVYQEVAVTWPHGRLFNPLGLACTQRANGEGYGLLMHSPYATYETTLSGLLASEPVELDRFPRPVGAATALCPAEGDAGTACTVAMPMPAAEGTPSIVFRRPDRARPGYANETELGLVGSRPWQRVGGATVRCSDVASLLPPGTRSPPEWCHLLAAWDGQRLPIAVVPLSSGLGGLPSSDTLVRPTLDVPINATGAERGVLAVDVEAQRGRLSVLTGDMRLEMWDLFKFQRLGSWRLDWPASAGRFKPAALCGSTEDGLLFLGRSRARGALLLHAEVMWGLGEPGFLDPSPTSDGAMGTLATRLSRVSASVISLSS